MLIREMEFGDVEPAAAIEAEGSLTPWDAKGLLTWMLRDDTVFLVAEEDGEAVGVCGLLLIPWESEVTNVTVKEAFRRKGIGGALLKEAFERAKARGVREAYLEVRESNAPAVALYKKLGFEAVGRRRNYYTEPVEDAILMKASFGE